MSPGNKVFIVDDQAGEIGSLIRRIKKRGYEIELATNERDARAGIDQIADDPGQYAAGIFDIMVSTIDLETLLDMSDGVDLAEEIFKPSIDTGIRLCRYVREEKDLDAEAFPIAALSVRDDDQLKSSLRALGVPLYERGVDDTSERSIMSFVDRYLPELGNPDKRS